MKHRALTMLLTVFVVLALVSCDFMYETNFFRTDMNVNADELGTASVAELSDMADSESFFTSLAEDEEARTAVLLNLDDIIANGTDDEKEDASLLATEILIYSSPAGELVSNVGEVLLTLGSSTEAPDLTDPADLLGALLPEGMMDESGVITDPDAFVAMINAMDESYDYYVIFSDNLTAEDYSSGELGDIAMTAMMASVVAGIEPPAGSDYASTGDYLLALLDGSATEEPTMELGVDPALQELFSAAGMDELLAMMSGSEG